LAEQQTDILAVNNKLLNTLLLLFFQHCVSKLDKVLSKYCLFDLFSAIKHKTKDFKTNPDLMDLIDKIRQFSKYCLFDLFSAIKHKTKEIR
jgi:predicted SprT family Zn-dependent metalloprotease